MALNEAILPLILYRKAKTSEHVNVRTSCHISRPCFITFSASAAVPFLLLLILFLLVHALFLQHRLGCMGLVPKRHNVIKF